MTQPMPLRMSERSEKHRSGFFTRALERAGTDPKLFAAPQKRAAFSRL